ncbi:unnamed protein product [Spirodela intermedia]|uniref:Uncharacterized protein n=1 Tax=Spirodela intermedia TaxID=51605 RepID=A0A7I8JAB2_SPIIN|nr:unnamed protein product [Spirodela intermedia]CAA6667077.1 unnamed protein product [Spirodela intermedia]
MRAPSPPPPPVPTERGEIDEEKRWCIRKIPCGPHDVPQVSSSGDADAHRKGLLGAPRSPLHRAHLFREENCNYVGVAASRPHRDHAFAAEDCGTIGDLKELFSSRSCAAKRILDHSHSEIVKELEASRVRLSKHADMSATLREVEKDYRKMSERITENMELMKASYTELITEAQASASLCKVTILELAQSLEKEIDSLRSRYKIPLTSA